MNVIFEDLQQLDNSKNGMQLATEPEIASLFRSFIGRKPFLFSLCGENGFMLTIGLANDCASVQYSSSDGLPPYLMAVTDDMGEDDNFVEFLAGSTPTPIPRRLCLPVERVVEITNAFVTNGIKSDAVQWEEI